MRELVSQNRLVIAHHLSKSKKFKVIVKAHMSYGLLLNKGSKARKRHKSAHIYTPKNYSIDVAIIWIQKASSISNERCINYNKDHAVCYSKQSKRWKVCVFRENKNLHSKGKAQLMNMEKNNEKFKWKQINNACKTDLQEQNSLFFFTLSAG